MRLEQVLLLVGVIGIAAWRVYRMSKGMALHDDQTPTSAR